MFSLSDLTLRVFISYSRSDLIVPRLEQHIHDLGKVAGRDVHLVDTWRDLVSIPAGADWNKEIERGMANAHLVCLFISTASMSSENVRKEIDMVRARNKDMVSVLCSAVDASNLDAEASSAFTYISTINWIPLEGMTADLAHPNLSRLDSAIKTRWTARMHEIRAGFKDIQRERPMIEALIYSEHPWAVRYLVERVRERMRGHYDAATAQYYVCALAAMQSDYAQRELEKLRDWWRKEIPPAYTVLLERALKKPCPPTS